MNLDRSRELELSWDQVKEADGYQLQISRSRLFGEAVVDRRRVKSSATLGVNDEGNFYWRVAAYGPDGVLGPWSSLRKFRALSLDGIGWKDTVAPQLQVAKMMVNGNIVIITGRTEPGVRVEIDGQRTPVEADGSFSPVGHPRGGGPGRRQGVGGGRLGQPDRGQSAGLHRDHVKGTADEPKSQRSVKRGRIRVETVGGVPVSGRCSGID